MSETTRDGVVIKMWSLVKMWCSSGCVCVCVVKGVCGASQVFITF